MNDKVIDFKKSKEKLIHKRYPNLQKIFNDGKNSSYFESGKALQNFQNIFFEYQEYLFDKNNKKEIKFEEVLLYFNKYFDAIYKDLTSFEYKKIPEFKEALDYAVLSNGKRIRPLLMLFTYNLCGGNDFLVISPFMVAMELIHTFSLVHDDLPCMDNDELRRGKPTVWKKYGEDIAVLVGDTLLMQATTILIDTIIDSGSSEYSWYTTSSAGVLMNLAGTDGMITGQVFDVLNTGNTELSVDDISYMYDKKTTALIIASILVGANMSLNSFNEELMERLGFCIGQAFQIKDDLLEIESTTDKIGKSTKSDSNNNKVTYVSKVGVEKAKETIEYLFDTCMDIIDTIEDSNNKKNAIVFREFVKKLFAREK